ncbi:hypothetical protein ACFU90_33550 [Streptomyces noursei]|uniref:hypothetical protein n=1 Tax=Streptomyces noursei TaxID=1971 RepID=UPI001F313FCF|nr:hypothetical protein [Streptomyces noursei]
MGVRKACRVVAESLQRGRSRQVLERLLQQVQATVDASGEIDWDISVDSTVVRAHQHAAGARTDPPPAPASKGAVRPEHQDETPWQSLVARLVEVVLEVRAWAARAAGPPPNST